MVYRQMEKRTAFGSTRIVDVRREMFREVVGPGKALAARLAVVGPLARVNAQVPRQVALTSERAAAEQTHKRTLTCMLPHVQLQILLGAYALAAERTREPPLPVSLSIVVLHKPENARMRAGAFEFTVGARLALRTISH